MTMSREQLSEELATSSRLLYESRQVGQRLRKLRAERLSQVMRKYSPKATYRAERRALVDEEYLDHLKKILETNESTWRAKVRWETASMLGSLMLPM